MEPITPTEIVDSLYQMPFRLYDFQSEVVDSLSQYSRTGLYMDVGTGKTAVSTYMALYKVYEQGVDQIIVIMPPILLTSWSRWLAKIPGLTQTVYRGTPSSRKKLDKSKDFILMSTQIFKKDFMSLIKHYEGRNIYMIVDEATSIRNVTTQNHRRLRDFCQNRGMTLLTGTAVSNPMQCYGYIKLIAPEVYRSKKIFEMLHVAERDFWGNVSRWKSLDMMAENMMIQSVRILADDVLELPEIVYDDVPYLLAPVHMKLYRELAENQLLLLPDGGKIDATTAQRLFQSLQQIVMNPSHFAGKPMRPTGLDIVDSTLLELGKDKLIIFSNYRMTNRFLLKYLQPYNAVGLYGEIANGIKQKNIDSFINDPDCRVLVAAPGSGGVGLNLQETCRCILFLELPSTQMFIQAVGRVHRDGQKRKVLIKVATALGTIQIPTMQSFLAKDELIQCITPTKQSLRTAIFGG